MGELQKLSGQKVLMSYERTITKSPNERKQDFFAGARQLTTLIQNRIDRREEKVRDDRYTALEGDDRLIGVVDVVLFRHGARLAAG